MINIKKYANGKFFDSAAKEYINPEKLAEMIKKDEKIQVTIAKNGKDITDAVLEQFSKKDEVKQDKKKMEIEIPFLKTDKMTEWLGNIIDTKIEQVMGIIKLPTRTQVARLDDNIKELNKKIDALELSHGKTAENKTETYDSKVRSHAAFTESENHRRVSTALNAAS